MSVPGEGPSNVLESESNDDRLQGVRSEGQSVWCVGGCHNGCGEITGN